MSSSQSPIESPPSWTEKLRAASRVRSDGTAGPGTRFDSVVGTSLIVLWSFVVLRHLPLQFNARGVFLRVDPSQLAAEPLLLMGAGLAGIGFAYGLLGERVIGYTGSLVLTGLWMAPIGSNTRAILFFVFWYLLAINLRLVAR